MSKKTIITTMVVIGIVNVAIWLIAFQNRNDKSEVDVSVSPSVKVDPTPPEYTEPKDPNPKPEKVIQAELPDPSRLRWERPERKPGNIGPIRNIINGIKVTEDFEDRDRLYEQLVLRIGAFCSEGDHSESIRMWMAWYEAHKGKEKAALRLLRTGAANARQQEPYYRYVAENYRGTKAWTDVLWRTAEMYHKQKNYEAALFGWERALDQENLSEYGKYKCVLGKQKTLRALKRFDELKQFQSEVFTALDKKEKPTKREKKMLRGHEWGEVVKHRDYDMLLAFMKKYPDSTSGKAVKRHLEDKESLSVEVNRKNWGLPPLTKEKERQ